MALLSKLILIGRVVIGFACILLGVAGAGFCLLTILDPIGSKMSDDGDPFGVPPSRVESALMYLGYLVILALGIWLLSGQFSENREPPLKALKSEVVP